MNNETPYQRHLRRLDRTPTSEADALIKNIEDAYQRLIDSWNSDPKTPNNLKVDAVPLHEAEFFNELIKHGAPSGDELAEAYRLRHPASKDGVFDIGESESLPVALAYCIQAYRADAEGKKDLAWTYIIDARTWFTPSLMLKPVKIARSHKRNKKRSDCSAAGRISSEIRYGSYREFVINEYQSGGWKSAVRKNRKNTGARAAAAVIASKLEEMVKDSGCKGLSIYGDNAFRWTYRVILEFEKSRK